MDLTCLTRQRVSAELSGLNVNLDPNGCHRVVRSLTGYITDQSSAPGVPAGSQAVQQRHNNTHHIQTHTHTWGGGLIGNTWNITVELINFGDKQVTVTKLN